VSLLAPLYLLAAAAIALPIIFHLIRRTPQKRQVFSSLMFLTPSPPRLTRRSRLTNILLLLLRAAALALLAFAFARPFFYRAADINQSVTQGKRLALLVDTSASIRRGNLWEQAKKQVEQALADVTPADEVALFLFDRGVHPAFTFDQWNQLEPTRRAPMLRARLDDASPTWLSTNLGDALASVADQLAEGKSSTPHSNEVVSRRQIVLISDLQQGSHVEALQGHEWPEGVLLEVKALTLPQTTNANVQLVQDQSDAAESNAAAPLRVRATNQPGSTVDQFTIAWENAGGPLPMLEPQKVYCPAGRSAIARLAWPGPGQPVADRLVLHGDDFNFDNTLYLVPPKQEQVRVVYVGDDAPDDAKRMSYYLRDALPDSPQQKIDFVQRRGDALADADLAGARLVVVTATLDDNRAEMVRRFVEAGGTVLNVLTPGLRYSEDPGPALRSTSGPASVKPLLLDATIDESTSRDFALVARIDLDNPVFTAFNDPRFADFTKVHFWHHRRVQLRDPDSAHAIAWFDDGDPFILERAIGKGELLTFTAGWPPSDSQLALSTKFVPLIGGMLPHADASVAQAQYSVGDTVAPPPQSSPDQKWSLHAPDGHGISSTTADVPGLYHWVSGDTQFPVAVNVSPDESRTAPLTVADLEQWGAKVGTQPPPQVLVARQRQLKLFELENRQKMWRWLLLVVLGLVAAETALAGRLSRRGAKQQPSASGVTASV
jgi:hypothetical protein